MCEKFNFVKAILQFLPRGFFSRLGLIWRKNIKIVSKNVKVNLRNYRTVFLSAFYHLQDFFVKSNIFFCDLMIWVILWKHIVKITEHLSLSKVFDEYSMKSTHRRLISRNILQTRESGAVWKNEKIAFQLKNISWKQLIRLYLDITLISRNFSVIPTIQLHEISATIFFFVKISYFLADRWCITPTQPVF